MMSKRLAAGSLLSLLLALVMFTSGAVQAAEPGDLPTPPTGYAYDVQTVNVSSFTQSVGSELVITGDMSSTTGWTLGTGWSISGGVASDAGGTTGLLQVTANVAAGTYQAQYDVVSHSAGRTYSFVANNYGSNQDTTGTVNDLVNRVSGTGTASIGIYSFGFAGSIDNVSIKRLTLNATSAATADATHTFYFTLPASPLAGQRVEMRYRYGDAANYFVAALQRNSSNTDWNFTLQKLVSGITTTLITANSVGSGINAIRVMTVANVHYLYTGVSGTFTARNSVSDSALSANTNLLTVYNSAITPGSLTSWSIVVPSTATPTSTATATITATPTITPTPTATPTPNIWIYGTLPPEVSATGQAYAVVWQIDAGNIWIALILFAQFCTLTIIAVNMQRASQRRQAVQQRRNIDDE